MADEISQTLGGKDGVQTALNDVSTAARKLFHNEEGSREQLVQAARELVHAAEHPIERACWSIWAEVSHFEMPICWRVLIKVSASPCRLYAHRYRLEAFRDGDCGWRALEVRRRVGRSHGCIAQAGRTHSPRLCKCTNA